MSEYVVGKITALSADSHVHHGRELFDKLQAAPGARRETLTVRPSTVTLRPITLEECQLVREWRNDPLVLPMLRTANPLTAEQQAAFYRNVVCNRASGHRYYAIVRPCPIDTTSMSDKTPQFVWRDQFIGMGGLTYLTRRAGEAEISLILGPQFRGNGFGAAAVDALLTEAYDVLKLEAVVGECYEKNGARDFWARMLERRRPVSRSWRWEKS